MQKVPETQMKPGVRSRSERNLAKSNEIETEVTRFFSKRTGLCRTRRIQNEISDSAAFLSRKEDETLQDASRDLVSGGSTRIRAEPSGIGRNGVVQGVDFALGRKQKEASKGFRDHRTCDSTEAGKNRPKRWRDLPRSRTPRGARTRRA